MARNSHFRLARRETQIMEVVYRLGRVSVADVLAQLPDPPSYSAVRATMNLLEEKGYLTKSASEKAHVYAAAEAKARQRAQVTNAAQRSATSSKNFRSAAATAKIAAAQ